VRFRKISCRIKCCCCVIRRTYYPSFNQAHICIITPTVCYRVGFSFHIDSNSLNSRAGWNCKTIPSTVQIIANSSVKTRCSIGIVRRLCPCWICPSDSAYASIVYTGARASCRSQRDCIRTKQKIDKNKYNKTCHRYFYSNRTAYEINLITRA